MTAHVTPGNRFGPIGLTEFDAGAIEEFQQEIFCFFRIIEDLDDNRFCIPCRLGQDTVQPVDMVLGQVFCFSYQRTSYQEPVNAAAKECQDSVVDRPYDRLAVNIKGCIENNRYPGYLMIFLYY